MSERVIRLKFGGHEVDAVEVAVEQSAEHWNTYRLADNTVITMKTVATKIFRIKDKYDDEGNPAYAVKSQNLTSVSSPENLKKK